MANNPIFEAFVEHTASYGLDIQCAMSGDADAEIVLVGEYPGESEVAFNKPFVGGAGKHLWRVLGQNGITKNDCYCTNVIKRRVTTAAKCDHSEFLLWQEALQYELSLLTGPKVIVCLGNAAMSALLGFEGITQFRGSVYEYNDCKVVVANNPSIVLRMPQNEIIFAMDMEKVKRVFVGDYKEHVIEKHINPTFTEAMGYIAAIKNSHKKFAMDIEVIGGETACIGLAHSAHYAMCINLRDKHNHRFTVEQEYHLLRAFVDLCDDPTTFVIAQNGNFDSYFMGYKDHALFLLDFDTLLAHHTLYPRLPHNLGFLTSQYTDHPYYKDEKDAFREGGDIDGFWRYNCTDAALTFAIAEKLQEELLQQSMSDFFFNQVMRINRHLARATVNGVAVDHERRSELKTALRRDLQDKMDAFQKAIQIALNDPDKIVNPRSGPQLKKLFFDDLNFKSTRKSTDEKVRTEWLKDPRILPEQRDVIIALNRYTTEAKFYSTYVDVKLDADGRFRSEYKQYGVAKAPGRLSSSQTLWGSGGNAQNLPHRAYEMFVADNGCVFIYFDLAQAEARYVGWDANIEKWKEDFEKARIVPGFDAHRSLASDMFGVEYELVPKEDIDPETGLVTIRFIAKRCRHGLNYRMHIARLAETTGMTYGQAAKNYYAYHRTNPELKVWWDRLIREVKKTRMLYNSYGRRLFITERMDTDDALDSIVAFRPQATIGDKVQRVWAQCHEDDRWNMNKARICKNVHDALWGIATPDYAMTALSIMKKYAEEPIPVTSIVTGKSEQMIIPADCKISNPEGKPTMANMMKVELDAAA